MLFAVAGCYEDLKAIYDYYIKFYLYTPQKEPDWVHYTFIFWDCKKDVGNILNSKPQYWKSKLK